jgi:hypothetical protein
MTELQERFLRKAGERLPLERVVEIHLFPPIRQGGMETGIAIVAADPEGWTGSEPVAEAPVTEATYSPALACDPTDDAAGPAPVAFDDAAVAAEDVPAGEAAAMAADDEAPDPEALAEGEVLAGEMAAEIAGMHARQPRRHTVYTARYRATLKGPERGRFEVDVHEEADAPLITIDAVVRGVQHRAGEPTEPERLTGEQLRSLAAPVGTK